MLWDWIEALTLGLIQGLTEFLPVSSDGHLTVAKEAFDTLRHRPSEGDQRLFFFVLLHLGTLAAILVHYRAVIRTAWRGLLGSELVAPEYRRVALLRMAALVAVATAPAALVGLTMKKQVEATFESTSIAAYGFVFTALVLAWTGRRLTSLPPTEQGFGHIGARLTGFKEALIIGCAQAVAILPGVSRSGMTIAAALLLGLSRGWAVGFSLLMAVAAISGAAVLEMRDMNWAALPADTLPWTLAAVALAGVVGYLAIIWLVRVVRSGRLWYFSVYLVALAAVVLALTRGREAPPQKEGPFERPAAVDGSLRDRPARAGDRPVRLGSLVRVDRPDPACASTSPPPGRRDQPAGPHLG